MCWQGAGAADEGGKEGGETSIPTALLCPIPQAFSASETCTRAFGYCGKPTVNGISDANRSENMHFLRGLRVAQYWN